MSARLGVLASGGGTTLQSIIDATVAGDLPATVAVVVSNNSRSGAADRAQQHGIPFAHRSRRTHPEPPDLDRSVRDALIAHDVDWVVLAGFMRKVGPATLAHFRGKVVNTHPGPLPQFGGPGMYGRHVHEAVIAAGVDASAVTVHLVDEQYDHGPVVAAAPVPIEPGLTAEALEDRVREVERAFYVATLGRLIRGELP